MNNKFLFPVFILFFSTLLFFSCSSTQTASGKTSGQETKAGTYAIRTIAFYNLENLFDTIDDPNKLDERSPIMESHANRSKIYRAKVENMAKVISKIGTDKAKEPPVLVGVAEVENRQVLEDLIHTPYLEKWNYGIIHYESHDYRGIDVALLYRRDHFKPVKTKSYNVKLYDAGNRVYTRDQLLVQGLLDSDMIFLIVNHWPSRRGGEAKSRPLRMGAARYNKMMIDSLQKMYDHPLIIGMGDLNDDPINASLKQVLHATGNKKEVKEGGIYNPMEEMFRRGLSTLGYRDNINLFDQIFMTSPALPAKDDDYKTWKFFKAGIYNPSFLTTQSGRYKGYPFRSFSGGTFTGGYSDHYPVYIYLIRKK